MLALTLALVLAGLKGAASFGAPRTRMVTAHIGAGAGRGTTLRLKIQKDFILLCSIVFKQLLCHAAVIAF